ARLRAAEGLPIELDVEAFRFEEAFLLGDEIVEPHTLRGDFYALERRCHLCSSRSAPCKNTSFCARMLVRDARPSTARSRGMSPKKWRQRNVPPSARYRACRSRIAPTLIAARRALPVTKKPGASAGPDVLARYRGSARLAAQPYHHVDPGDLVAVGRDRHLVEHQLRAR